MAIEITGTSREDKVVAAVEATTKAVDAADLEIIIQDLIIRT